MDAFRGHYDDLNAEDKVMDKAFKREFNDVTAVQQDQLYRLFRKRPRSVAFCTPTYKSKCVPLSPKLIMLHSKIVITLAMV